MLRLTKLLISCCVAGFDCLLQMVQRTLGRQSRTRCVVLYYHAVRSEARGQFAWQMDELLRLSAVLDIEGPGSVPRRRRYSAVTFDDGFVSVLDNALPELESRSIPCVIFVPTGSIGRRPRWIEVSHHDTGEQVASTEVWRALAVHPLVRIGSHSVSHPNFCRLNDEQARAELAESKAALEQILGRSVKSFSFPHGAHTQRCISLARQCGYERVYTIEPQQLRSPDEGFVVGRVRVEPHDWHMEFRLKVVGAYRWMVHVSAVKQRLHNIVRAGGASPDNRWGAGSE